MNDLYDEVEKIIEEKRIYSVFQPIVSLRDCKIAGYEALSRIKGESAVRNSEELFRLASESGKIWRLEQLCRKNTFKALSREFSTKYKKLLFLNVSPGVMNDKDFREGFTREFVEKSKIKTAQIVFEITEREAITDMESFLKALEHYRNQNYQIAIDDVGSGYSGLGLICDVHPRFVKIDMKIIRDIHRNRLRYAMVKSLAELASAADIELIAEGVECEEEMDALVKIGVRYAQGYYFSRPAESFEQTEQSLKLVRERVKSANSLHNRTCRYGITAFCIKNIAREGVTVPVSMRIGELSEILSERCDLAGVTVTSGGKVMGIITREKLSEKLSGRYGFSLYQNKEVVAVMDNDCLTVDSTMSVKDVSDMAMERRSDAVYDFIVVTKNDDYLGIVTIRELLLKAMEIAVLAARDTNPLSGLPGNNAVRKKIEDSIEERGKTRSIVYIDIDNFKAYNDVYGFARGDSMIKALAGAMKDAASSDDFVGHIGGDDFVAVIAGGDYESYFEAAAKRFTLEALRLYSEKDRKNGYITAANRKGIVENFPLVALTAAAASNEFSPFPSREELMKLLSVRKKVGKAVSGSCIIGNENG